MIPLGKPLVFHLKSMAEMNHLYGDAMFGGDDPDLTGLEEAEHVREMVRVVGAEAYEQAADFLEECGESIIKHFRGQKNVDLAHEKSRGTVLRDWYWRVRV